MMQRAREAVGPNTKLIGVTQLTSTDQRVLNEELGIAGTVEESVLQYAGLARKAGLDGVVCSPLEVQNLKAQLGQEFLAVTPGVRPQGASAEDQKRTLTPKEAILAGSDYLVVGRPILAAADPRAAFLKIVEEIEVGS